MPRLDVAYCRSQFPSLALAVEGEPVAYLDGPSGTQVPRATLEAMREYFLVANANVGGTYRTGEATDRTITAARQAAADLLGAGADEVAFGANMTTLNYALSRALGRKLQPGDEVVVTDLDHEANVGPWRALEEKGVVVRTVPLDPSTCRLAPLKDCLGSRTRVVALGYASNAVGTVNDVPWAARLCREVGAILVVDAVHYLPHGPVDVKTLGCDFLLGSAYKFFGPHLGILYGRRDAFEALETYRLRTQLDRPPDKIETGTLNHEGLAGLVGTVSFLAELGERAGAKGDRRARLVAAMTAIAAYEEELGERLRRGLAAIPGVRLYGPPAGAPRTPTYAFTHDRFNPRAVAAHLGQRGVFVGNGHFYALAPVERLGLAGRGGLVRAGLAPYNTAADVDRLLEGLGDLAG